MALPKLNNAPSYEMIIPSSGKKVRYRPFLVKEQKSLMLAAESNDNKVMFRSVLDILVQCIDDKIYESQLAAFDVEYMFLQLRSKSVGESSDISIKCDQCSHANDIKIQLDTIKVEIDNNVEKKISITDDIKVQLKYPSYIDMIESGIGEGELNSDQMFNIMHSCIEYVETPDERIDMKDVEKKEVTEFIESMNTEQFKLLQDFLTTMPRLSHTVKFKCKECKHDNELLVEGISNFL